MSKDSLNYDDHTHTEYSGKVGFEKKLHKTHFSGVDKRFRARSDWPLEWVKVREGKWKLLPKRRVTRDSEVHDTA